MAAEEEEEEDAAEKQEGGEGAGAAGRTGPACATAPGSEEGEGRRAGAR